MKVKFFSDEWESHKELEVFVNDWIESKDVNVESVSTTATDEKVLVTVLYSEKTEIGKDQKPSVMNEGKYGDDFDAVDGLELTCKECGRPMSLRHRHADGAPFYGCSGFPNCKTIVKYEDGQDMLKDMREDMAEDADMDAQRVFFDDDDEIPF